jgi:hypothetical protein
MSSFVILNGNGSGSSNSGTSTGIGTSTQHQKKLLDAMQDLQKQSAVTRKSQLVAAQGQT